MRAVQIAETGGPEVMKVVDRPVPDPGTGQVRITVAAAGLNFIDTYHRSGVYDVDLPRVLGSEVAGVVNAVGNAVDGFSVGDAVVTVGAEGAYAEQCLASAAALFHLPEGFDLEIAAAAALQGLTAHYLAHSTYALAAGDRCLVHAGAGGVGGLLIQIAKRIGAEVFATVGTAEKSQVARQAGADHVIVYTQEDFAEAVHTIIGPDEGLDVVYDGVGKATFDQSLSVLRPRGLMALFGGASGQVPPFDLQRLNAGGSLYITRPSLGHHLTPPEGQQRADDLFGWIESGELSVRVGARYSLEEAAEAHRALEGRSTTGKVLIIP